MRLMPRMPGHPSAASPTSARKFWDQRRLDAELFSHACLVVDRLRPTVDLPNAGANDALREVLLGCLDADLLDALGRGRVMRDRSQRVVSLEIDHRPDSNTMATSASSNGWNCASNAGSIPTPVLEPPQRPFRNDSITWSVATPMWFAPASIISKRYSERQQPRRRACS